MGRPASSFRRVAPRFNPQPRVLVLCEDERSALSYLNDAARHFRSYALVKIAHCGRTDPLGIINEAIKTRGSFDRVFCVIDRDSHESFKAALNRASAFRQSIRIFPSYPCYEFWLLLHFRFTRSPVVAAGAQSAGARMASELRTQEGMAGYDKGSATSVFGQLLPRLPDARANAARALAAAKSEQEMNPSTEMHLLIDELERLGAPMLAAAAAR